MVTNSQSTRRGLCHVCGKSTDICCSDCRLNFDAAVYVCGSTACMDAHETKCAGPGFDLGALQILREKSRGL